MSSVAPNLSTGSPHAWSQSSSMPKRDFVVLVTDSENPIRSAFMTVQATDPHDAKLKARGQLAITRRDHWHVEMVTEANA